MNPVVQVADARQLPFRSNYFGLVFCNPPWDNLEVFFEAEKEITRVLKKRGRWAVLLPHKSNPDLGVVALSNHDRSQAESFTIPRPSRQIGPRYFSVDEDVVHLVLDKMPWVRTLIDPFCGVGTIVKVARERGLEAYGTDIDPEAIAVAEESL